MQDNSIAVWEERWVTLQPGSGRAFVDGYLGAIWPALEAAGAVPLGCLNGVIGPPADDWLLVTGFPSFEIYASIQNRLRAAACGEADELEEKAGEVLRRRHDLVASERVRLVRACPQRPRSKIDPADRRDYYGVRHFYVPQPDWPDFLSASADGVWPLIESQGVRILGMFRDIAATDPVDVVLLTGYRGPAHWEATRGSSYPRPDDFPEESWLAAEAAAARRPKLIQRSYVWLMRAHWPALPAS